MTLMGLTLIGCSSGKTAATSSNLSSRSMPTTDDSSSDNSSQGPLADCNQVDGLEFGLKGATSTYYDPTSNSYILDLIRFKLNEVPNEIATTDTHYMQIFAWYPTDNYGNRAYSSAVRMYFMLHGTGEIINQNKPVTTLSRNSIQQMIVDYNLSKKGITDVETFFDAVVIHLQGMDMTYDAMTIALYDANQGQDAYGRIDSLLPAFSANPNTYMASHPTVSLQELHPNFARRFSGMSDQAYLNITDNFCKEFFWFIQCDERPKPSLENIKKAAQSAAFFMFKTLKTT